jgi:hypothetical protein
VAVAGKGNCGPRRRTTEPGLECIGHVEALFVVESIQPPIEYVEEFGSKQDALRKACKYFIQPSTKERPIRLHGPNVEKIDATEIESECRRLMREADVYRQTT